MDEQPSHKFHITLQQDPEWKCYLFGNKPETGSYGIVAFARAIEAAHGIKENT